MLRRNNIFGRHGAIWPIGIQCKKKTVWPVTVVTEAELIKEVEKAKLFRPKLKSFYLISTAPDDEALQKRARTITQEHEAKGLFRVLVLGWGEIVRRAIRHPDVAAKHFGVSPSGRTSPLLATWRATDGKLQMEERELSVAIKELIHDMRDFPDGRIALRQHETEELLEQIANLRKIQTRSVEKREAIITLRDKLKLLTDRESEVVAGLTLLFRHKDLSDQLRLVWTSNAALLVRSFIDQQLEMNTPNVRGMERIKLHPPGALDDNIISIYLNSTEWASIFQHRKNLKDKYPRLATDNVFELPNDVQFGRAIPAILHRIIFNVDNRISLDAMVDAGWFHLHLWRTE